MRALGQLVVDLGDSGMLKIMPILHRHLAEAPGTKNSHIRKAVCLGFSEVLNRAEKEYIGAYLNEIVKTVCMKLKQLSLSLSKFVAFPRFRIC